MAYAIAYHPDVVSDLERLPRNLQARVLLAIGARLGSEPEKYGRPLSGKLIRYRKLRVGDVRVVYEVVRERVVVYAALDRGSVYGEVTRRLGL